MVMMKYLVIHFMNSYQGLANFLLTKVNIYFKLKNDFIKFSLSKLNRKLEFGKFN